MFTGIITEIGKVVSVKESSSGKIFEISAKQILKNKKIGQSVAVNGACMTITKLSKGKFQFDAMTETLEVTNLKYFKKGDSINLEPSLKASDSLEGHIVSGHIDCLGEVFEIEKKNKRYTLIIKFPLTIAKYLAFKGSITVNGVSLTISKLEDHNLHVDLIPHTLKMTNLSLLKKGDKVNLEIDILARYLEAMLNSKEGQAKYHFLKERNLI